MDPILSKRIQTLEKGLSPAEQRLVEVLMQSPEAASFESVAQLATRAQTHASALVRLAQRLGFSGFPELRKALRAELTQARRTDDLIRARLDDSRDTDILSRLIEREMTALHDLSKYVSQAQIDAAADTILSAERVCVIAEGTAEALARHATHRLRRAGKVMIHLHSDPRALAEGAAILRPDDAVIGFTLRQVPVLMMRFFAHVQQDGAKTILISDLSGLTMRPAPDHLLAASRGHDMESGTLTVSMAVLNALILTCADRGQPQTLASYENYAITRDTFK